MIDESVGSRYLPREEKRRARRRIFSFLCLLLLAAPAIRAQISSFPYTEHFSSVVPPALPPGWIASTNRSASGDFISTTSSVHTTPYALISTNATISQSVTGPTLNFSAATPLKLEFYTARSSTHTAGLLVEASTDDGATFPIALSDTIRNPGSTGYFLTSLPLPSSLANETTVRIRWRLVGVPSGGASGTFRLDDISITTAAAFDLAVSRLDITQVVQDGEPSLTEPINLRATVRNVGTLPAAGYEVQFFRDSNHNGIAEAAERFAKAAGSPLNPSDSAFAEATHPPPGSGTHRFFAVVSYAQDGNPANDTASATVSIGAEKNSVVINEIMYEPLSGQNEWVEFFHRGTAPVDLAGWKFSDRPTASGVNSFVITATSVTIQPGDFVVAAAESTILSLFPYLASSSPTVHLFILNRSGGFGLNNDGDDIVLRDVTGQTIDSVSYSPSWHHPDVTDTKGRSLERINPDLGSNDRRNWSTSPVAAGGTPGRANGIYATSLPSSASVSISPNPFSPDGDGFEDFCIIRYNLPTSTSLIRITIFDIKGRLLRTLANAELSGPQGEIIWDGLDDGKQRVRIGPYILFLEAIDSQGGTIATAKAVVVVATKL
jgi:hypothetical protein